MSGKPYSYGGYKVTVAADGAIAVKAGDAISHYCMAIYHDFNLMEERFGLKDQSGRVQSFGDTVGANINLIIAGSTIYDMKTHGDGYVPIEPSDGPPNVNEVIVGQALNSIDCGWFSGFAVAQHWKRGGGAARLSFTVEQVYEARNKETGISESKASLPTFGGNNFVKNAQAVNYLESLGVGGYQAVTFTSRQIDELDDETFASELRRATGNGRNGIMISAFRHWIAALNIETFDGIDHVYVYDSYPRNGVPDRVRDNGSGTAGTHLCWIEFFDFKRYLSEGMTNRFGLAGFVKK